MKKGNCQGTSTSASSQLVKKKKKNGLKKYNNTQSKKHQSKKSANQKTIMKRQKPFLREENGKKLHVVEKTQKTKNGRGSGHHEITSFPRSWHHEKNNHHAVPVPGPRKPSMKNAAAEGAK